MKIRKTYLEINPELLFSEIRDFSLKQGLELKENQLETYTLPDQSASFIVRGTLTFSAAGGKNECLRAHIVGMARGETKLMLDSDDAVFPEAGMKALQEDLDFIFTEYEED